MKLTTSIILLISSFALTMAINATLYHVRTVQKTNQDGVTFHDITYDNTIEQASDSPLSEDFLKEAQGLHPEWIYMRSDNVLVGLGEYIGPYQCYSYPKGESPLIPIEGSSPTDCFSTLIDEGSTFMIFNTTKPE